MNTFKMNKLIYEEILNMEELYNNTPMEYIKENLHQIKEKRRERYSKHCKAHNMKIGKFRLFEDIFSEQTEHSYFNKAHPSNIPFVTLIKICNRLNVNFEDIIKEPPKRKIREQNSFYIKWTEELINEFIKDFENSMAYEQMASKYNISVNTVLSFYPLFKEGKNCNGKPRNI